MKRPTSSSKQMQSGRDSCHGRVIRNQQYWFPKFPPTAVVKLLQYSGSRVEHRDGFSSYKLFVSWFKMLRLSFGFSDFH